jgi:FOG: Ankyrin repeat
VRGISVLLAIAVAIVVQGEPAEQGSLLFQAIRNGDLAFVKAHLTKAEIEVRDGRGATPLMHAAAFGNLETLKLLLEAGADVNARNAFDATALLWAARDPDKARLLIEHGANVNIRSKQGRTPLMVASLRYGNSPLVALMLAKGADVNAKDEKRHDTALSLAASVGDVETMRLLLAKGADPLTEDHLGQTPISQATSSKRPEAVRLLIQSGADVTAVSDLTGPPQRNGPTNRARITALHNAAAFGPVEIVQELLKAGAKVNARDSRGLTPLVFALAADNPSVEIVQALLQAGADANARDTSGETPLDWAEKFGYPDVIAALNKSAAKRSVTYTAPKRPEGARPKPEEALKRTLKLLESTSAEYFKQSGCIGCHHHPLIARAQSAARVAGLSVNEIAAREQRAQMRSQWVGLQEEFLQTLNPGGGANRLSENLLGLKAAGYAPDTITDSAIVDLAESQEPEGSWRMGEVQLRPPITESAFGSTTRAIRALQAYSIPAREKEFTERIARACAWLQRTKPSTTEDFSMRLSGLVWCGTSVAEVKNAGQALLSLQRSDGGWGGNPHMRSDAFATGVALVTLAESKVIRVSDDAYRRGVEFLLSNQFPDGAWHVRSRAIKFQPYFESGFPFGHDQWISTAATAWAAQAIALSLQPAGVVAHVR